MKTRRNMHWDFFVFNAKINPENLWTFVLDSLFFVISLLLCLRDILRLEKHFLTIALLVVSILNIVFTIYCKTTATRALKEKLIHSKLEQVRMPLQVQDGAVAISHCDYRWGVHRQGSFLYSCPVNAFLMSDAPLKCSILENSKKRCDQMIRENYDMLSLLLRKNYLDALHSGSMFVNEEKLCINKDIYVDDPAVFCHKGCYYDTFLTNISWCRQLVSTKNNNVLATNTVFSCCDSQGIKSLSSTYMNNEIGISTIAFTDGNTMVLWVQNPRAQSSQGMLVPSGSGSCDWDDRQGDDFRATIRYAMERELVEESVLGDEAGLRMETKIIGYFRWLEKGGKPEFVGMTRVHLPVCEFACDADEVYEKRELSFESVEALPSVIENFLHEHEDKVSVPLFVNFRFISELCKENPQFIRDFLETTSSKEDSPCPISKPR